MGSSSDLNNSRPYVVLKKIGRHEWAVFGPKGNMIGHKRCGSSLSNGLKWAKAFMSSWTNIAIKVEYDEQKDTT